ncbi:uncharacterized protein LAESUDRAFT_124198 [Laetiporus sulphureus 93-53]|uniref:Pericentrin/AKAP-450 centrosomal targeting domain-containing protein n=1 Tax=Laetiporus sulphureus 93-53 TaxID=1314785 RepID=A0A165ELT0_9APHY|nr:uncharacterized protein LAESUDRAFT_124198 [Laetiporus sulphureus 93-53]KZT07323.1 hypothetical protein LAESUDRAFT_124198 [Laetiporus sulphureus 93-53]
MHCPNFPIAGAITQKADMLQKKVAQNAEIIEQLRQERSLLMADFKQLQQHYSEVSEHAKKLREEHAASQTTHDERRHQLDLRLLEIEELKQALSAQADELQRAESEKKRIAAEKSDVARSVAELEADLQRVKKNAEEFGRDLQLLRAQKERLEEEKKHEQLRAERAQKQSQTQIRLLKEELESRREQAKIVDQQSRNHVCAADEQQVATMKSQHNKECKGLLVQIHYLKAKFTRESTLRSDLGYQKHYLLVLLARFERDEQKILAAIARIGFPSAELPVVVPKRRKLKSVLISVLFLASKRYMA